MELTFKREEILERLRVNREEHVKIVREAQDGYRDQWRELLVEALEQLDAGKSIQPVLSLQVPENHIDDFNRAIEMFEMATDEEVCLEEGEFQMYVRNKWRWQTHFLASNSAYSVSASELLD